MTIQLLRLDFIQALLIKKGCNDIGRWFEETWGWSQGLNTSLTTAALKAKDTTPTVRKQLMARVMEVQTQSVTVSYRAQEWDQPVTSYVYWTLSRREVGHGCPISEATRA